MGRKLSELVPEAKKKVELLLEKCKAADIPVLVIETGRTHDVQEAYYAQGREPIESVNDKRRAAGLWEISEKENRRTVTQTLKSKHIEGKAADICLLDGKGALWWSAPKEKWLEFGALAESCGLTWGGRWGARDANSLGWDCPHVEIA